MTKTQEYLYILANGGEIQDSCCMTLTQSLIAGATRRVNSLEEEIRAFVPINNNEIDAIVAEGE